MLKLIKRLFRRDSGTERTQEAIKAARRQWQAFSSAFPNGLDKETR